LLVKNIFSLALSQVFGRIIRFGYLIVIARFLPPSQVGLYLYGVAIYLSVIGVAQFGQNIFLAKRLGQLRKTQSSTLKNSLIVSLGFTFGVSILLTVYIICTEALVSQRIVVLCFVGALISRSLSSWVRAVFVAIEQPSWIPRYELIFRSAEAFTGIFILNLGGSVLAISIIHFLFWFIEAAFAFAKLLKLQPLVLKVKPNLKYMRGIISVSKYFFISTSIIALFSQIAIVMLRFYNVDLAFIGVFALSMQFFTALIIIPDVITNAFMPRLARAFKKGDGGKDFVTAIKLLWVVSIVVSIAASTFGSFFIPFLLGDSYLLAADLFFWLTWCFTPYALAIFIGQSLNVLDREKLSIWVMLLMVFVHVILLLLLIDTNVLLASIGSLWCAVFLSACLALYIVRKLISSNGFFWLTKLVSLSGVCFFIIHYYQDQLVWSFLISLSFLTLGVIFFEVFDERDKSAIKRVISC
jgi:O-antigen/teichoic acid export membrane protein